MSQLKFELDHIGIAVESLDQGQNFYSALGLGAMSTERVASEKVTVGMFELANDARIELLEASEPESPVGKFLKKRGPGIHHICLRVSNIEAALEQLKQKGIQLIDEKPKPGAHGCMVAFVHPKATGGILIELSQPGGQP